MSEREKDLMEFLKMLDFKKLGNGEIELVSNRFELQELPDTIKEYLVYYFTFLDLLA